MTCQDARGDNLSRSDNFSFPLVRKSISTEAWLMLIQNQRNGEMCEQAIHLIRARLHVDQSVN